MSTPRTRETAAKRANRARKREPDKNEVGEARNNPLKKLYFTGFFTLDIKGGVVVCVMKQLFYRVTHSAEGE